MRLVSTLSLMLVSLVFCAVITAANAGGPGVDRVVFDRFEKREGQLNAIAPFRRFSGVPANARASVQQTNATIHDFDPAILALQGDPEYGEYLSGECVTCHQVEGGYSGIPSITSWPEEDFVIAMHAYKNKARPNPVMQAIAARLSAEEIAALAAYFASLGQ